MQQHKFRGLSETQLFTFYLWTTESNVRFSPMSPESREIMILFSTYNLIELLSLNETQR